MSEARDDLGTQLASVVGALRETLGADAVAVMLLDRSERLRVVGAADGPGRAFEAAQEATGDGPGPEAVRTGAPVVIEDIRTSPWAGLVPEGGGDDAPRSVLAVPVIVGDVTVGNVNVLSLEPRRWTDAAVAQAAATAGAVAALLGAAAAAGGAPHGALRAAEVFGGLLGDGSGEDR